MHRIRRFAMGLVVVLVGCSETSTTAPAGPDLIVDVTITSGVASPLLQSGPRTVRAGDRVSYDFSAMPGFEELSVTLDGNPVASSGTIVVVGSHRLEAVAWAIATPPTSPVGMALYNAHGQNISAALATQLVSSLATAALNRDAATLEQIRAAEYAALRAHGPAGRHQLFRNLAGRTYNLTSEWATQLESAAAAASTDDLFVADTIVPTTFIFVNGILNSASDAVQTTQNLLALLAATGFDPVTYVSRPNSARPGQRVRIYAHHNPIIAAQIPYLECIATLDWAAAISGTGSLRERLARMGNALREALGVITDPACREVLTGNLAMFSQYLGSTAPSFVDQALISLIANERQSNGGRNVILVGHSQGSMIARTAVNNVAAAGVAHRGCVGVLVLGSPLGMDANWGHASIVRRIIAKGEEEGIHDILFPLGGSGRTDGLASSLSGQMDEVARGFPVKKDASYYRWLVAAQFELHGMASTYLAETGYRGPIATQAGDLYDGLSSACGGRLQGSVLDLATGQAIVGATARATRGAHTAPAALTGSDGRFSTAVLGATLHDLVIEAAGYTPLTLRQRLVPFNATADAEGGPIYLARPCSGQGCLMQGTYAARYHLSGTSGAGEPLTCSFETRISLRQTGNTFDGVITNDREQTGCFAGGSYIIWRAGITSMTGTAQGATIVFEHWANPPWNMHGAVLEGGFRATEPAWRPGTFHLRVEMTATRTSSQPEPLPQTWGVLRQRGGPAVERVQ